MAMRDLVNGGAACAELSPMPYLAPLPKLSRKG
ncbi:BnaA02g08780D [Brassica napus]|uniref:BnaA02g08780D protein n=1 Tax=Brassica napus TaxID=3708 RepID=A0A078G7W6_BRANA|nr:BnaA02g08780D [Brassica napus]